MNIRKPAIECADMVEIRAQVNDLDREIIKLLGERLQYVKSAVAFKPTEDSIRHPDHWSSFIAARGAWGQEEGYEPAVIETVYRGLYDFTIKIQLQLFHSSRDQAGVNDDVTAGNTAREWLSSRALRPT